ncbi:MAG: SIMPL domain-containing protein [Gemmatimonadota bacterium]
MFTWLALAACGGAGSTGQGVSDGPRPVADEGNLARPIVYEVPVDPGVRSQVSDDEPGFIEVNGNASVTVPVDLARVAFAVETRSVTASDAAAENALLMDAVLRAVRGGDVPGLTVETFGYTLRPEYSFDESRVRTIEGYTALNNVRATTTDVDAVGTVIDLAIAAGANRVSSIAFETADTESARAEALALAVRNARAQARTIAETLGYELGAALEVRGGADRPSPRSIDMGMMLMRAESAPTPIEAGDRTVTANVTVRFALGAVLPGR